MADAITIQELIDARTDAKTLEEAVNGDAVTTVLSRLGESYPTLANALSQIDGKLDSADAQIKQAITDLFQNGGLPATPFATKALMEASELVDGQYAQVTDDTVNNGLYVKTSGAWVKSTYDPLGQAKADATTKAETAKNEAIVESKLFTTSAIEDRDRGTPILTGQQIFDKSQASTGMFTAIWSEYNKPIWHIGSSVFIDSVGAKVKLVEEEFVITLKLVEKDQRFKLFNVGIPIGDPDRVQVDWGDGTSEEVRWVTVYHNFVGEIGDEFVVTLTGAMKDFSFNAPSGGDNSAACLKSIDKNTLPKITKKFSLNHCYNLEYLCDGAFSSLSGESLNLRLFSVNPEITFNDGLFNGTGHVTNIDNILVGTVGGDFRDTTITPMLFSNFGNVTSAANLLTGYPKALTKDNLKYLVNLEIAAGMLRNCKDIADSNILDNQTKLINVNNCFISTGGSASALEIYNNMVANNPDITTHSECFKSTSLTGLSSIPVGWK